MEAKQIPGGTGWHWAGPWLPWLLLQVPSFPAWPSPSKQINSIRNFSNPPPVALSKNNHYIFPTRKWNITYIGWFKLTLSPHAFDPTTPSWAVSQPGERLALPPMYRKVPTQFPHYRRDITSTGDGIHTESLFAFWAQWHQHRWNPAEATTSQCAQIRNWGSNQHKKPQPRWMWNNV